MIQQNAAFWVVETRAWGL